MKKKKKDSYPWKFASVGGTVRVNIQSGKDIAHLGELDRKLWTVLSCPVNGLEFDEATLKAIDRDGDGKIRVDEVIATAQWLTRILKDPELLLKCHLLHRFQEGHVCIVGILPKRLWDASRS